MSTPVASPCMMWRKWSAMILLVTVLLIQEAATTWDLLEILSVRKCHCNKTQGWDGNTCRNSFTILSIYNKIDFDPMKDEVNLSKYGMNVPTSVVENVTIMALECPEGLFHSTIETVLLLPDGHLLWLDTMSVLTNDKFCVEFFWEMGQTFFAAQVCLPPPEVPHCCPANHLLHQDGSCHPHQTLQAPPLQLGLHVVEWDHVRGNMVTLTCGQHEFYHQINLGGEELLGDTQPTATLAWKPSFWVASPNWTHNYCVAPQQMETGELQYVAQICFKDHDRYHHHQCNNSLCIRKCCPQNALVYKGICVQALDESEIWQPSQIPNQEINEQWKLVVGEPGCSAHAYFGEVHLLPNGFLLVSSEKVPLPPSRYCLDNYQVNSENITNFSVLCFPPEDTTRQWRDILIKVLVGFSCVFLMATLAVYLGMTVL